MKRSLSCTFFLTVLSLDIAGCAVMESKFASSPYGIEVKSMVHACLEMKENGLLPGIDAGEDTPFELKNEGVEFSKRNDVTYPLLLNCILVKDDQEYSFPFMKQSPNSKWNLSQ